MKKSKIIGWKHVFSFTFTQTAKSKSFLTSTFIMGLVLFLAMFGVNVYSALNQKNQEEQSITSEQEVTEEKKAPKKKEFAHTIYVLDDTGFGISEEELQAYIDKKYEGTKLSVAEKDHETMISEMDQGDADAAYLHLSCGNSGIEIDLYLPKDTTFSEKDADKFVSHIKSYLKKWKDESLGLTKEQNQFLSADITTSVTTANHGSLVENLVKMYIPMFTCLVLYLCIILYGQMVGTSVATEKSSKVMELLLTSIKPLAIIIGKVLSMMVLSLVQIAILALLAFGGNAVGAVVASQLNSDYSNLFIDMLTECNLLTVFSPVRILLALIVFVLGFTFYCTFAGLMGATVNRGEDLSSAMTVYSTVSVIGFMLAYLPSMLNSLENAKGVLAFAAIFPLSSPFFLPSKILMNDISGGVMIAGIAVLAVSLVLLVFAVAKIYEMVILYSGNKIGLKQIREMLKNGKEA